MVLKVAERAAEEVLKKAQSCSVVEAVEVLEVPD